MTGPHLSDDRLLECCLALQSGDSVDPPAADHLTDCDVCAGRLAQWQELFAAVHETAVVETDAQFPTSALETQRAKITRRIERLGQQARVLSFPGRSTGDARPHRRSVPRWVAAAAAAGLFLGVTAGRLYRPSVAGLTAAREQSVDSRGPQISAVSIPSVLEPAGTDGLAEGLFLDELELAIEGPQTSALLAFDTLTPRVRDISTVVR